MDIEAVGGGVFDDQHAADDGGCDGGGVNACVGFSLAEGKSDGSGDASTVVLAKDGGAICSVVWRSYPLWSAGVIETRSGRQTVEDPIDEQDRLFARVCESRVGRRSPELCASRLVFAIRVISLYCMGFPMGQMMFNQHQAFVVLAPPSEIMMSVMVCQRRRMVVL